MRIARILSLFILFSAVTVYVWANDASMSQKTVSGTVAQVDHVGSTIAVSYVDTVSGGADEINIIVPDEAEIMNGAETSYFCNIEQFDPVEVTYYDDGVSGLKATRIMDLNQPNR